MTQKTKKAFIIRDFTDAGTGESFTAKSIPLISEGAFLNYKAAGLVRVPTPEEERAAQAKPSA